MQRAMKPKGGVFSIEQWFEHVNSPSESPLTNGLHLEGIRHAEGGIPWDASVHNTWGVLGLHFCVPSLMTGVC